MVKITKSLLPRFFWNRNSNFRAVSSFELAGWDMRNKIGSRYKQKNKEKLKIFLI